MNIENKVPAAFSTSKSDVRSNNYDFVSTEQIINVLKDHNWNIHSASQTRVQKKNIKNINFTKHLITFQNPDLKVINGVSPQINIINSHDGSTPFKMMAGLYRFVCENGLIISDAEFNTLSVRHRFLNPEVISNGIKEIVDIVPLITAKSEEMNSKILSLVDQLQLSDNVIKRVWTDNDKPSPFEAIQLLESRRNNDNKPTLWNSYNKIQENIFKGGIIGKTTTNKKRKMKGITNIDKTVKINKILWEETSQFLLAA